MQFAVCSCRAASRTAHGKSSAGEMPASPQYTVGGDIANKNYKPQILRGRDARVPTVHSGGLTLLTRTTNRKSSAGETPAPPQYTVGGHSYQKLHTANPPRARCPRPHSTQWGLTLLNNNYKPQTLRGRDARVPTVHTRIFTRVFASLRLCVDKNCGMRARFLLEYPQFLTPETGHRPDSIGRNAFLEVK